MQLKLFVLLIPRAQQDRWRLFVGNEILSAWIAQLIAAGRYRLWKIKARGDKSKPRNSKSETNPKSKSPKTRSVAPAGCRFFLRLMNPGKDSALTQEQSRLIQEAQELSNIFGAIARKCETPG